MEYFEDDTEIGLGTITFKVSGTWPNGDWSDFSSDEIPIEIYDYLNRFTAQLKQRIDDNLGFEIWLDNQEIRSGSIQYRAKIVTTAAVVLTFGQAYDLVSKYPDFRDGVVAISQDVGTVASKAAETIKGINEFKFFPPERHEIEDDLNGARAVKTSRLPKP